MKLIGKRVIHIHTGEIKIIASVEPNGVATFEDGTCGDIHVWREPTNQQCKVWKYVDEDNPPSIQNYSIY
jgi:hypothetical protein